MHAETQDVRSLVGRKVDDPASRFQTLLDEIRRLRRRPRTVDRDLEERQRQLLILSLLTGHGPREDRLLRYQLDELSRHLRRLAAAGLAA